MEKIKYHFKNLFPIIYLLFIFLTGIIAMIIGGTIIIANLFHIATWIAAVLYTILLLTTIPVFIWVNYIIWINSI